MYKIEKKLSLLTGITTLSIISLFMLISAETFSWQNVKIGGGGGYIPNIIYNPTQPGLVYAKTDMGGLYRRDSVSKVWIPLTDWVAPEDWNMLGGESFATDPVEPNICYFASGTYTNEWTDMNGRILRSKDYGNSWEIFEMPFKFGGNMPGRGMGERLAIDPNSNNILYFGARSGKGLWKSDDFGETWTRVSSFPVTGDYIQDPEYEYTADPLGIVWVEFDKTSSEQGKPTSRIFAGAAQKSGPTVFMSADAGVTWSAVYGQPLGPDTLHIMPHHGVVADSFLYVPYNNKAGPYDGNYGEVWKYNFHTNVWVDITPHNHLIDEAWGRGELKSEKPYYGYGGFSVDPQNPDVIIVATVNCWWPDAIMFKSLNGGASWTRSFYWTNYPQAKFKYVMDPAGITGKYPWMDHGQKSNWPDVVAIKLGHMISGIAINPFNSDEIMYGTGGTIFGSQNFTDWGDSTKPLVKIVSVAEGVEECAILSLAVPPITAGSGSDVKLITGAGDIGGMTHTNLQKSTQMFLKPRFNRTTSIDYAELDPAKVVRVGVCSPDRYEDTVNIALSRDGGLSWNKMYSIDKSHKKGIVAVSAQGKQILWASAGKIPFCGSIDGPKESNLPADVWVASDRVTDSVFYAFKDSIFYSGSGADFRESKERLPFPSGKIKATPGFKGHVWIPAGKNGLWRTADGGKSFSQIDPDVVQWADVVGFGKAAPQADYPAVYITGKVSGKTGIYMSKDQGRTWIRINDDKHQYGSINYAITGDMRKYGIVFVGTNGRGVVYGDISNTNNKNIHFNKKISLAKRIIRNGTMIRVSGKESLNLYSVRGTLIASGQSDGIKARIDLSNYAKGIYIARSGREFMKIIISK